MVPPRFRTSQGLERVKAARRCHLSSQISPPSSRNLRAQPHAACRARVPLCCHVTRGCAGISGQAELRARADIVVQNIEEMAVLCQEHLILQWMRPIVTPLAQSFSLQESFIPKSHSICGSQINQWIKLSSACDWRGQTNQSYETLHSPMSVVYTFFM